MSNKLVVRPTREDAIPGNWNGQILFVQLGPWLAQVRHNGIVVLDGAVILTANQRFVPFAQLPRDCWPSQHVTLLVARIRGEGRLEPERLDISPQGRSSGIL